MPDVATRTEREADERRAAPLPAARRRHRLARRRHGDQTAERPAAARICASCWRYRGARLQDRLARHQGALQADVPRHRLGAARAALHVGRLRRGLRQVREVPRRQTSPTRSSSSRGSLPMQYFTSSLTGSSTSLVQNVSLVTKVYFPRVLLPLAARDRADRRLPDRVVVLLGLMAWYDTWPAGAEVLLAPAFLGLAFVTALGVGLPPLGRERPLPGRAVRAAGLPAGAAAPLGRALRRQRDPGEVAVAPVLQPDDHRDQRLALGGARRPGPRARRSLPSALPSRSCCCSAGSPTSVAPRRRSRTDLELMATAIAAEAALQAVPDRRAAGRVRHAA